MYLNIPKIFDLEKVPNSDESLHRRNITEMNTIKQDVDDLNQLI